MSYRNHYSFVQELKILTINQLKLLRTNKTHYTPRQELELGAELRLSLDVACLGQQLKVVPQLLTHLKVELQGCGGSDGGRHSKKIIIHTD